MRLIYLSVSWIAGICLGTWAGSHWAAFAAIAGAVILAFLLRRRRALLVVCLLVLLGGILRFQSTVTVVDEGTLSFYNDAGIVQIRGLIGDDPETTDSAVRLRLEAREIRVGEEWVEVSGAALVYAPRFPAPGYTSLQRRRAILPFTAMETWCRSGAGCRHLRCSRDLTGGSTLLFGAYTPLSPVLTR